MSDASEKPWSDNPYAPQIPSWLYLVEKASFNGITVGVIFYGIVVALFFQCMSVLLSPANPIKRGIRWALVAHTVAMFSFVTIDVVIPQYNLSTIYINDRGFPGNNVYPPGPLGYEFFISDEAAPNPLNDVLYVMYPLNQWLADGLLLHRCFVVYSMNYWVMVFPCLIYLASVATGLAHICQESGVRLSVITSINIGISYFSISLSLNIILMFMIVTRLVLHIRNIRKAVGNSDGSSGLRAIATMLVESYSLYAITLLIYTISWAVRGQWTSVFANIVSPSQVIAPYLITLRVAKRRELTNTANSGTVESMRFRSQATTDGSGTLPDRDFLNSMDVDGNTPGEPGAGAKDAIEEVL